MFVYCFKTLRARLDSLSRRDSSTCPKPEPPPYTMHPLVQYSYLFSRSETFLGGLSTRELRVWFDTVCSAQLRLLRRTRVVLGTRSRGGYGKKKTQGFAGAPSPPNLLSLVPSAERKSPTSGILKPPSSKPVEECMPSATHDRHVSWGETQVQPIDRIGCTFLHEPCHTGYQEYRKKRLLLQYVIDKDAEFYRDLLLSDSRFANKQISRQKAQNLLLKLVGQLPSVEDIVKNMIQGEFDAELHHASRVLLSSRHLDFKLRLLIHEYFALTEPDQKSAANHADIALELAMRASGIPTGPKSMYNLVVDRALRANLPKELEDAQKVLQLVNQGQRVNVCWNQLTQGGEGQRIYMENQEYKELATPSAPQQTEAIGRVASTTETATKATPQADAVKKIVFELGAEWDDDSDEENISSSNGLIRHDPASTPKYA
ncbi:hypothetical protein E4T49_06044 [Aureobasidium sp. EXF-10728]|nr:hypothetical protein E4T49_06044 [Aureobasidium sp. EXF-10728]